MRRVLGTTLGSRFACETPRKRARLLAAAAVAVWLTALPGVAWSQAIQPAPAVAGQTEAAPPHEAAGPAEVQHAGGGVVDVLARLVNFSLLAGTLWYLLRSPIASYLTNRGTAIRRDLVEAAEMRRAAGEQIAEIDRRMKALPAELEALRTQGAAEIAAEEARIRAAAEAERNRLLEQARREIDQQIKLAERDLISHAADLAVGVASRRIRATITDDDQRRLVDRYVTQLQK
ncbi:MAG: hypothetical protein ACM3SQ_06660 [Betaproteobacteria bacterium]